jgi:3-dehydroquinate synthase
MRGIPLIQVPTTLLAMADSALGGKNGINLPAGKNLLGTFHQPRKVYIDTDVLRSLPQQELANGLAEIVKCALIRNRRFFAWLEQNMAALRTRDETALRLAVAASIRVKMAVVRADERERDARRVLNYGHTVGHALESLSGHQLSHGRAIAIGMNVAARLSESELGLPPGERERQNGLLAAAGLETDLPATIATDLLLEKMRLDKKARDGAPRFVLLERIGTARIDCPVDPGRAADLLESLR